MTIDKIDLELCNGCGICVLSCPEDVIRMDKKNEKAVIKYPEECQMCEWCAKDCPEEAITVLLKKGLHIIASWQ
jgi:NAD-dependent dihydropyrimidine dehydrogenase PreA subunit